MQRAPPASTIDVLERNLSSAAEMFEGHSATVTEGSPLVTAGDALQTFIASVNLATLAVDRQERFLREVGNLGAKLQGRLTLTHNIAALRDNEDSHPCALSEEWLIEMLAIPERALPLVTCLRLDCPLDSIGLTALKVDDSRATTIEGWRA